MKKQFYKLTNANNQGRREYVLVNNAKEVKLPNFPDIKCFAERIKIGSLISYNIFEEKTGQLLFFGKAELGFLNTLKHAIEMANISMEINGIEYFDKSVNFAQVNYGISPGFKA